MWQNLMEKVKTVVGAEPEAAAGTAERETAAAKSASAAVKKPAAPQTTAEFVDLLKRTPRTVLNDTARARIAAVMSFDDRTVADVMTPKSQMVFVNEKDFLGPLMLDKLYKSGFTNFPVVNNYNRVCGVIHTEALNMLEIKKTDRAQKYMDKDVEYLHISDTLMEAVTEIERTNAYYFLVLDDNEELAGFFTVQHLLDYLLGM